MLSHTPSTRDIAVTEWITSLDLTAIVTSCLMGQLQAKAHGDPRFEKAFIKKLGNSDPAEAAVLVRNLLEPASDEAPSFAATVAARIAEGAREVTHEMEEQEQEALRKAQERKARLRKAKMLGKFFDEQPAEQGGAQGDGSGGAAASSRQQAASKGITLQFGDLKDFIMGVEQLVGPPDPVSLAAGMRKDHCNATDARIEFTTSNYGVTSTSEVEYWFVTDPTPERLARLGRSAWPREALLVGEREHLCRKPRPLSDFLDTQRQINLRLEPLQLRLTDDMLVSCRLYTGPCFIKYNSILRGVHGRVPFFTQSMEGLCHGNLYPSTIHVTNKALKVLSSMSKCQCVYRGVAGGLLPPEFALESELDGFRGGVEFAFMSTTTNREVALSYAKSSDNGLVFEIWMGMVDKGADVSGFSQYPHEAEVCFPPLTALEVRGTRIDGSLTMVSTDARVNTAQFEGDRSAELQLFKSADDDLSGEIDRGEFGKLARQVVPTITEDTLDTIFAQADANASGEISYDEFRAQCLPRLRAEEADETERKKQAAEAARRAEREAHLREIVDAEERVAARARAQAQAEAQKSEAHVAALTAAHHSETKQLEANIAALTAAHQAKTQQLTERYEAQATKLRDEHAKSVEQAESQAQAVQAQRAAEVAALKASHESEDQRLADWHEAQAGKLREQHAKSVARLEEEAASLRRSHADELRALSEAHARKVSKIEEQAASARSTAEGTLANVQQAHAKEVGALTKSRDAQLAKLASEMERRRGEHEGELASLREAHAKQVAELVETHAAYATATEAAHSTRLSEMQAAHEAAVATLAREHSAAVANMEEAHAAAVSSLKALHAKEAAEIRNAHSAREAKDKQESAQAIAEVKSAAARRHEQMRAAHESEVSSVKKAHGQRVAGLEARVETLERKYSSETKEMKEALLSSRDQYEGFKAKVAREFHSSVAREVEQRRKEMAITAAEVCLESLGARPREPVQGLGQIAGHKLLGNLTSFITTQTSPRHGSPEGGGELQQQMARMEASNRLAGKKAAKADAKYFAGAIANAEQHGSPRRLRPTASALHQQPAPQPTSHAEQHQHGSPRLRPTATALHLQHQSTTPPPSAMSTPLPRPASAGARYISPPTTPRGQQQQQQQQHQNQRPRPSSAGERPRGAPSPRGVAFAAPASEPRRGAGAAGSR